MTADESIMTIPQAYVKPLKEGDKNTTLKVGPQAQHYKKGNVYRAVVEETGEELGLYVMVTNLTHYTSLSALLKDQPQIQLTWKDKWHLWRDRLRVFREKRGIDLIRLYVIVPAFFSDVHVQVTNDPTA